MPSELRREIEYLNLGMVNEAKVIMEVEPTLEVEIREGQFEITRLVTSQKIAKVPYGLANGYVFLT
jgi:hypothetical protein